MKFRTLITIFAFLLTITQLQAQFSSSVDYVGQQKKIDKNRRFGVTLGGLTSSFDWKISNLKNLNSEFKDNEVDCNIDITTSVFTVGAYYGEKSNNFDILFNGALTNLNRSANVKVTGNTTNVGFTVPEFTLWQYKLNGLIQMNNYPLFINGGTEITAFDNDNENSGAYFIYFKPGSQIYKNENTTLALSCGTTIFDDSYAAIYSHFLYLSEIPDQYFGKLQYDWHNKWHSAGISYKFGMLPEDIYNESSYSNIEGSYKYSLNRYNIGIGFTAGFNVGHNADQELTMPRMYYLLRFEGEYLNNCLLVGLDWELNSIKTNLTDDKQALAKTSEVLNNPNFDYKSVSTNNDSYNIKINIGFKL